MSNAGKETVSQPVFQWQIDTLAAAAANQQLEGDNSSASFPVTAATTLQGNYCQISYKLAIVSGTNEVAVDAGRDSEIGYQVAKRSLELKRDMEFGWDLNTAANAGATATARVSGGLDTWIKTNTDIGAGAAVPSYTQFPTGTRTDAGARAIGESNLKNILQLVFTSGGNPGTILCGPVTKQTISAFGGIATKTYYMSQAETAAIIGAADVYVSDYGTLTVVPSRFLRQVSSKVNSFYVIDWNLLATAYLRPFMVLPLAKTGDAEQRMILAEYGYKVKNEQGIGAVNDITN